MIHASANGQESAGAAIVFPRMGSRSWCSGAFTALAVVLALPSLAVAQTNGTWNVDANGSWSGTTNWLGNNVASGTNAIANFANVNLTAARTITVDGNYTIGSLNAGDTDALGAGTDTYTFSTGTLTLANTTGTPNINVALGGATAQRRIQFTTILAGTDGLTLTQSGGGAGGFAAVALKRINTFTGNITIGSGTYANFMYLDIGNVSSTGEAAQLGSGNFAGNIDIQGNNQMRFMTTLNNNLSGIISGGAGTVITLLAGTGTTTLSAANTFSGRFVLPTNASGVSSLNLGHANALQNGRLEISTTNTLRFSPSIGTFNVGRVSGAGGFALAATDNSAVTLSIGGASAGASDTISGTVSGVGGLTKVGSGTLTLSAANTYTGTTAVNAGVLAMNNAAALGTGTITFGGGTLQYGSGITADLSGRIAASGSAIAVDTGANNVAWATGLASTNTGGLTKLGSGALTLSAANSYSGGTTIRNGSVAVTTPANLGSGTISITPDAGTSTPSLRLNNTASGTYTQPITMSSASNPAFAMVDASSATAQVTLSGGITVSNNAFLVRLVAPTETTGSLVVDGNITGTGDLQLTGGGGAGVIQKNVNIGSAVLYVAGAGSTWSIGGGAYTWGTTNIQLATSTLRTTVDGVLPSASALSFNSAAGALDINGTRQTVGSVGGSVAGSRIILGSGTLTVSNTDASSFAGEISGAGGSLVKTNSGTLTLSAANTYSGTTAVNAGVLAMNNAAALGTTGMVTFGGGTLQYGSGITADLSGRIAASGSAIAVDTGANNVAWATGLASTNTGGLTKLGSGTLTLSASNAYTGGSTISAGRLVVGHVNALGSSTSALAVNGGTLDLDGRSISVGALSGSSGATITTSSSPGTATLTTTVNSNSTFAGSIADNGSGRVALTKTGNSANVLALTGTNTFTGDISVAGGYLDLGTTGLLGSGSYGGNISIASAGGGQFRILANANQTLSGTISGDGTLWMVTGGAGTGTTTLTAANTLTGPVLAGNAFSTVGVVPTLRLGNANALQSARLVVSASNKLVFSPGIGTFNVGSVEASGTLPGDLTLQDTSGAAITLSAGGNDRSTTYGRVLSGLGGLTKVGSGTLTLSAANTYTGTTTISAGRLALSGGDNRLATAAPITITGGVLDLGSAGQSTSGVISFRGGTVQSGTLTSTGGAFDGQAGTVSAILAGNGIGLTKTTSGTLTLTAANTFSGTTTVGDGIVRFNSVAAGANAQALGGGTVVNLGVASTSSGEIDYFSATSGTLEKNVFALGNGRNRIRNSGGGTLALTGTLTKNGTILELAGGTFNVTGLITGASANSDLFVNGANVTLSNANNDYNGPTYVYGGGSLTLGASNVIPGNSALILGGTGSDTGTGTINTGLFTDTVASLTTSSLGATIGISGNGVTIGGLTTTGNLSFGAGTDTLALSLTSLTLGRYTLMTYAGTRSGTFDSVTGNGNYSVVYGAASNGTIDLQLKANQASTFSLTPAASRVLVGGSTQLSGVLANTSPTDSAALSWNPASTGTLTASGFTSSAGSTIAAGSTSTITAWVAAGNTAGPQSWSITNTDNNAITTVSTATGSISVVNQRSFSLSSGTINLGTFLRVTAVTGSTTISSSGLNATTANASLGAFGGTNTNGFSLGTLDSTSFNGGSALQESLYTVSGSAASAGAIFGTFTSSVTAELGSIDPVSVSLVGTAYDPATASFNALSALTSVTVDIGSFNQNTGSHTKGFSIFNLFSDPTYTADLTLLSITDLDAPSSSLSIDLTPALFGNLVAGGTSNWLASLSSNNVGSFTNRYQLNFVSSKDSQPLGGPQSMTLTVTGVIVVPEPGAIALAAIGIAAAAWTRRRTHQK